jgi:hypothetical protein
MKFWNTEMYSWYELITPAISTETVLWLVPWCVAMNFFYFWFDNSRNCLMRLFLMKYAEMLALKYTSI